MNISTKSRQRIILCLYHKNINIVGLKYVIKLIDMMEENFISLIRYLLNKIKIIVNKYLKCKNHVLKLSEIKNKFKFDFEDSLNDLLIKELNHYILNKNHKHYVTFDELVHGLIDFIFYCFENQETEKHIIKGLGKIEI